MGKQASEFNESSVILHEDDRVVVIATGIITKTVNEKTGDMIQTWILVKDESPVSAVKSGNDAAVCFDCPLRLNQETGERGCYVTIFRAPQVIWNTYKAGRYRRAEVSEYQALFGGREVRFGSYGEPVLIPVPIVKAIVAVASGFTGYTHQWRNPLFQAYKAWFMASTSAGDYQVAEAAGWRTFTVSDEALPQHVLCPASEEAGYKTDCANCGLCRGQSRQARSIWIPTHGSKATIAAAQHALAA